MRFLGKFIVIFALLVGSTVSASAQVALSGEEICKKMIADGRNGGLNQTDCLCTHRVADAVLDNDVKALLFESWYNGTDNMRALEALPGRNRIKKQLATMKRALAKNCSVS